MKTKTFNSPEQSTLWKDIQSFQTAEEGSHDIVVQGVVMQGDVTKGFSATVLYTD